jgi:predicted permease
MGSSIVVFYKIGTICLLIFVGFLFRRMKILPENSVSFISKYMVYLALPALYIHYMPASVSIDMLASYWYYPFLAAFLVAVMDVFGFLTARVLAWPGEGATFRLITAFSNWLFVAITIVEPLYGEGGVRTVLLFNIGIMFYLWTFGLTGFRPATGVRDIVKKLFVNPQTISICIGLMFAFFLPEVRGMERFSSAELAALPFSLGLLSSFWTVLYLIGSTAMPIAIMQNGMILGAEKTGRAGATETRSLALVSVLRLLIAPTVVLGVQCVLYRFGILTDRAEFVSSVIIMASPAASQCVTIAELYNGASRLAARAILWTTVASLLTAPVMTLFAERVFSALAGA